MSDSVVGVQHPVNDVNDTAREEDIRVDDLGAVDVVATVDVLNGDVTAEEGRDGGGTVRDVGAVEDAVVYDVVAEDGYELARGGVGEGITNSLEGVVVGGKDGDIVEVAEGGSQVEGLSCTGEGSQVGIGKGRSEVSGNGEGTINNVDDTTGEVEVDCGGRNVVLEAAEEVGGLVDQDGFYDLSSSNVGERRVRQMSVRECGGDVVDVGSHDGAIQGVVADQRLDELGGESNTGGVQASKSRIARCKESDVSHVAEAAQQIELLEESPEGVELIIGQRNSSIGSSSDVSASGNVTTFSGILCRSNSCCKSKRSNLLETHDEEWQQMEAVEENGDSVSCQSPYSRKKRGLYVCFSLIVSSTWLVLGYPRIMQPVWQPLRVTRPWRDWWQAWNCLNC